MADIGYSGWYSMWYGYWHLLFTLSYISSGEFMTNHFFSHLFDTSWATDLIWIEAASDFHFFMLLTLLLLKYFTHFYGHLLIMDVMIVWWNWSGLNTRCSSYWYEMFQKYRNIESNFWKLCKIWHVISG